MNYRQFTRDQISEIRKYIYTIDDEQIYYDFMFYLCTELKFSIEEFNEIYDGSTFNDIKDILTNKYEIQFKKCSSCAQTRSLTSFTKQNKNGSTYRSYCKICNSRYRKQYRENNQVARQKHIEYMKKYNQTYTKANQENLKQKHHEYYKNNKDVLLQKQKEYFEQNKEEIQIRCKNYYDENKEHLIQKSREYKNKHLEEHKEYTKDYAKKHHDRLLTYKNNYNRTKYATDIEHRLRVCFGSNLYNSLKHKKGGQKWETIVGYTLEQLMEHLESKFDDKMTWENYGTYWHVDHIVGVANFNYTSYEDEAFKKCWSLENLQPLYGPDNLRKSDIISEEWGNVELAARLL